MLEKTTQHIKKQNKKEKNTDFFGISISFVDGLHHSQTITNDLSISQIASIITILELTKQDLLIEFEQRKSY